MTNRKTTDSRGLSLISPSPRGLNNITNSVVLLAFCLNCYSNRRQSLMLSKNVLLHAHRFIKLILPPNVSLRLIYEYHIYSHFDTYNRVIDMNFQNSLKMHDDSWIQNLIKVYIKNKLQLHMPYTVIFNDVNNLHAAEDMNFVNTYFLHNKKEIWTWHKEPALLLHRLVAL
jgi:hypothetical protein